MILYHGSNGIVEKPDVFHSRKRVDFVFSCRKGRDKSDYDIVTQNCGRDRRKTWKKLIQKILVKK